MLDLNFIRENPDLVVTKAKQKGYEVDVNGLLKLDDQIKGLTLELQQLQHNRNELASRFNKSKPSPEELKKGRELKEKIATLEDTIKQITDEFNKLYLAIPNMPLEDVPVGSTEAENKIIKEWGDPNSFDYQPKTHWEIGEQRGFIDKERAAKISGSRFTYIKGGLVELQFALLQYVLQKITDEKFIEQIIQDRQLNLSSIPFTPVLPPALVRTEAYEATGRLDAADVTYKLADDDLWLNASAEHSLANMYMGEILPVAQLPIRYIGYATSFRREAGTYGKDTEGIIRLHQFDKLEMESFSTPETGIDEHLLQSAIQEYLVQQLELPYHLIQKCTADIGKPNAAGVDIDTWMPGQGIFKETHTADYMTDYQARRLKTRLRRDDGSIEFVHTADATAFAMSRILAAIIENYQTHDGHIIVPSVLKPYLANREEL